MGSQARLGACTQNSPKRTQATPILSCKHDFISSSVRVRARLQPQRAESEGNAGSKDLFKSPGAMDGKIAALAIPALGTELIDPLLSACDTAFVGRLGVEPLAGVALASSVFTISSLGLNFLATASSPLITQALAGGDNASARAQVGNSITLAGILGIACVVVLEMWTSGILHIVAGSDGVSPETMQIAISYLRVRALGIPFTLIALALSGAFRGLLDTRTPLLVLLASNSINFCLDLLLIFGSSTLHVPAYGAPGAAAATVVAEVVAVASLLFALSKTEVFPQRLGFIGWEQIKEFAVAGSAVLGRTVALQTTIVLATATIARSEGDSSVDIAAHQVTLQTWFFLSYLMDSLAIAANGLVADGLGRGDPASARAAALRCLLYGGGVSAVLLGVLAGFPQGVSAIFTDSRSVQIASVPAIRVVAAMQPLNAVAFIGDGVYQGAKDFGYLAAATATACLAASIMMVTGDGALVHVWQALAVLQAGRGLGVTARWLGLNAWGFGPSPLLASGEESAAAALLGDTTDENRESP